MIVKSLSRWTAWFAIAFALGGCVSDGNVSPTISGSANLAFDTIDGPPPQVFGRFVEALNGGAEAQALPTTSRQAQAAYRIRAYLAAQTSRKQTSIAWVFDVYDAGQQRTLRLSGEEPVGRIGRGDAWAAADDQLLRRIARKGMAEIAILIKGGMPAGGTQPLPAAAQPVSAGPAIANAGDSSSNGAQTTPAYRSAIAFRTD